MRSRNLGIDVSKNQLDVVLLEGNQTVHRIFENNLQGWEQLAQWIGCDLDQLHICLEATGRYGDGVAHYLVAQGYYVSVVNPARIHAYGRSRLSRQKTDKADALLIAHFCQTQCPDRWSPPDLAIDNLKIMIRYQDELQQMLQQERNRLGSLPTEHPVGFIIQQHIQAIQEQLKLLRAQILTVIQQHPKLLAQYELLLSIPGIGHVTAATVLAEIGDIERFDYAEQVAAYAGLTPKHRRSGTSIHSHTPISKQGNARLRKALYFPAMVAIRHNPILKTFADRLRSTGLASKATIVAVMRKLLHLIFGILRSRQPFDPNFLLKQGRAT